MAYSGSSKVAFCSRLGADWRKLADYLEIAASDQVGFAQGDEARRLWAWLAERGQFSKLPAALQYIKRQDLLDTLQEQQQASFRDYFQDRLSEWSKDRFALDKRFVQLTLLLDQGEETQGPRWAAQPQKFQDLRVALAALRDHPAVVLLGPPGSGKSTLLGHVELDCAQEALAKNADELSTAPLTFFIALNLYKPEVKGQPLPPPKAWLEQRWASRRPDLPALDALLQEGRLILLLDALNEMPHQGVEHIEAWRDFLARLADERPGNRVIFSCRTQDYGAKLSTRALPVPQIRIEQLSDDQVREFIAKYHPQHGGALWAELRRNPRQLDLYRSPYYLRMLIDQAGLEGKIPAGRAGLFSSFVRQALDREITGDNPLFQPGELITAGDRERMAQNACTGGELPGEGLLFLALSVLAYRMQAMDRLRLKRQAALAVLREPEPAAATGLLAWLRRWRSPPPAQESGHYRPPQQPEQILTAGLDLRILDQDLQQEEVLFFHQLLQEYFAARRLAAQPDPQRVWTPWEARKAHPHLKAVLAALPDSEPLPLLPSTGWEETTVLAAAMTGNPEAFVTALMETNLPLAGRCAAQREVAISPDLRSRVQQALIERTQHPKADLRARIAAGLALGELGDPRFERCRGPYGEYLLPPLVKIPGGTYTIGSDEGLYQGEAPVHTVALPPFAIGQFPVTNAEWKPFMDAGGYEDERWWETEAAQAWQRGEGTAEGPKQDWRELRQQLQQNFDQIRVLHGQGRITSQDVDTYEAVARMTDDAFEALLSDGYPAGRQTQPAFWNDDAFNNPAQPVVGVCWYEARAYCAWLSAQTEQLFRLPTEAQWEAAARGQAGRRFAYGHDFDPCRCNAFETHIRRTTPVGVFPGGETPEGLVDMTGNTWDWTSSLYQPYLYDPKDGREKAEAEGRRVGRGGSWSYAQFYARAPSRAGRPPRSPRPQRGVAGGVCGPHLLIHWTTEH